MQVTQTLMTPVLTLSRRQAIGAVMASLMTFKPRMVRAVEPGTLTVDLNLFKAIRVVLHGKVVVLTAADIFAALEGK